MYLWKEVPYKYWKLSGSAFGRGLRYPSAIGFNIKESSLCRFIMTAEQKYVSGWVLSLTQKNNSHISPALLNFYRGSKSAKLGFNFRHGALAFEALRSNFETKQLCLKSKTHLECICLACVLHVFGTKHKGLISAPSEKRTGKKLLIH